MHVVVPDLRAAHGPVAAGIDGAGVVGFDAHMMNLVVFNDVVVAAEHDADVRRVVDEVPLGAVADAVQRNARTVHPVPAAVVVDVVARRVQFAGR